MREEFMQYTGNEDGPTSVVLVGVHGDEVCGVRALDLLLPSMRIERGTVWFGYGNPRAIEQGVRFTENNLNRMFKDDDAFLSDKKKSYEYDRAQYIKQYLDRADALLDVHASYTPDSAPFLICEQNAAGIMEYMPINRVVSGFDAIQPGGTDYYMNRKGKIGICVECGYLGDLSSTQRALESIRVFLACRGHISYEVAIREQSIIRINSMYLAQTDQFRLARQFCDFEELYTGEIIGVDGVETRCVERASVILFARDCDKKEEEAFLLGEKVSGLAKK
jgi:succinylglutamate desuccinylase